MYEALGSVPSATKTRVTARFLKRRWGSSLLIAPQLVGVDVVAALDLYVEQGQWDKCIETATKQVRLPSLPPISS